MNAAPPPVPTRPAEPVPQPEPEPDPDEIVPPRQDDLEYFEPERS
ncbi:MAG: hypothetical protein U0835_04470 [Isosphaeraceae bacterium]